MTRNIKSGHKPQEKKVVNKQTPKELKNEIQTDYDNKTNQEQRNQETKQDVQPTEAQRKPIEEIDQLMEDLTQRFEMSKKIARRQILKEKLIEKYKLGNFLCPLTEKSVFARINDDVLSYYVEDCLIHDISMTSREILYMKLRNLIKDYVEDHYSGYSEGEYLSRQPRIEIDYDLDDMEAWGKITISIENDLDMKVGKKPNLKTDFKS